MRDLNPLQFFRGNAADVVGELPDRKPELTKKPLTKVPSLLFDMELEEGQGRKETETTAHDSQRRLEHLAQPWSAPERQLMQQVECMFESESARGEAPEASTLAERLVQQGYSVTVRTALGGGGGCECLRNLRHVFVCVRLQGGNDFVLVDPKFKEQFEIAHPTPRYAALLEEVPACFVGTEERLVALVELLCSEMSAAFRGTGTTLPPWRQAPSMLSKWRPRRSTDERRTPALSVGCFTKHSSSGQFTVDVSAAAGLASPTVSPPPPSLRRSSLPARMGRDGPPVPVARTTSEGPASGRCRANVSRTAASLLAIELGDGRGSAAAPPRRIGPTKPWPKASDEDADSPTSVLDADEEPVPASALRWQLRGSLGKANDMLRTGMRQGIITGL